MNFSEIGGSKKKLRKWEETTLGEFERFVVIEGLGAKKVEEK